MTAKKKTSWYYCLDASMDALELVNMEEFDSEDSVDAALSSLEEAYTLTGLSPQEGDIGQEIQREMALKRRLCGIFKNPDFNQFVEVLCSDSFLQIRTF